MLLVAQMKVLILFHHVRDRLKRCKLSYLSSRRETNLCSGTTDSQTILTPL